MLMSKFQKTEKHQNLLSRLFNCISCNVVKTAF